MQRVLSCPTLPSLPGVGLQVLKLTRDPNVTAEQLAKVIETDAGLSAKVLRTVNSSLFALNTPCTTIRRAIGYLGLSAVKSIVLSFSLVDASNGVPGNEGFNLEEHWRRAIYAAAGARTIAQIVKTCDPEEAFTAALFQDIGSLACFMALKQDYVSVLAPAKGDHSQHSPLEQSSLSFTHAEVGAALASRWRLPDRYVQVIRHHHTPELGDPHAQALIRVAALGTMSSLTLTSAAPAQELAHLLCVANDWFGKSVSDIGPMLERVGESGRELARLFDKPLGEKPDIASIMEQANDELTLQQIGAHREAEKLRESNESLARQATTDGLTGLANRKRFDDEIARLFNDSRTVSRGFALLMLDGDRFKSVNDTHGHPVGDAVLKELSRRISTIAGDKGITCRYGGEEFAVLIPGASEKEAAVIAEDIRRAVQTPEFTFPGLAGAPKSLPVTVSIGVSATDPVSRAEYSEVAELIQAADRALYEAKHSGRNRVCTQNAPTLALEAVAQPAQQAARQTAHTSVQPSPAAASPRVSAPTPASATQSPANASAKAPQASAARPALATGPVQKVRVLLVEDDALAAKLLIMLIQKVPGCEVEWINDGDVALQRLAEASTLPGKRPHVIVSDLQLSGCDGFKLLTFRRGHPALAKIPFLAISTAAQGSKRSHEAIGSGATAYASKEELVTNLPIWISRITKAFGMLPVAA